MSLTQVVHRKGHISHVKAGTKKNRIKAHICHLGKEDGHRTKSLKQAADKSVGANNHLWNRETIFLFAAYGSSGPQRQCNRACYPKADFFFASGDTGCTRLAHTQQQTNFWQLKQ